jgi:hypothetical protein
MAQRLRTLQRELELTRSGATDHTYSDPQP